MNKSKLTIAEFLYQCRLRIINSIEDDSVQQHVSKMGYTLERLEHGRILLITSIQLCEKFDKEYGEVRSAFDQRDSAQDEADHLYNGFFTVARVAFKKNMAASITLKLNERAPRTHSAWLNRTRSFYKNLLANEKWMLAMAEFNLSEEQLTEGLKQVEKVESYVDVIMREKGDAQNATKERDAKLEELSEWINDYESIARIALKEQAQLLEKLGIIVK